MPRPTDADRLAARVPPPGKPVFLQRWTDALHLHWKWDAAEIQRTLPPGLMVDIFEGHAWLGIVLVFMDGVRLRLCPPLPGVSRLRVLGVRTYVYDGQGRPGVWFWSLDANGWLAAKIARTWYCLPCEHAEMPARADARARKIECRVRRRGADVGSRFVYHARSAPAGSGEPQVGTLEFFLVERYRHFSYDPGRGLFTGRIAHAPSWVGPAQVSQWDDAFVRLAGFEPDGRAPDHICHTSPMAVDVFGPERVAEPEVVLVPDPEAGGAGAVPA